jgi:hypothetical protein
MLLELRATRPTDARADERDHELIEESGLADTSLAFDEDELE